MRTDRTPAPGSLTPAPRRDEDGFTLVELMMALLIITVGVYGVSTLFVTALRTSNVSGHRTDATTLALRDIENMRAIPYDQLGFSATLSGFISTFVDGASTFTTATVPYSQLVQNPGPTQFRGMSFQLQRAIYWTGRDGLPGSAYKVTTVFERWTDQVGSHTVRQDAIIYPGGLGPAASTTTSTTVVGLPNPSNMTAVQAPLLPSSAIDLAWTAGVQPPVVTGWKIQFSTDNFATPQAFATLAANVTTTRVGGLAANTAYQFRVGSMNGAQGPVWSNVNTLATASTSILGPCLIVSERITPSTMTRALSTHQLQSTPAVAVVTSGLCTSLSLRFTPSGSTLQVSPLVPGTDSTSWTVNVPTAISWDLGDHVIAVWDNIADTEFPGSSGITVNEGTSG